MATILVAIFTEEKYPRIHFGLVLYYFITCPISLLFIGLSINSVNNFPLIISVAAPIIYFVGQAVLWSKYRFGNAIIELWAFLVLSLWTMVMTFA